MEGQDQDLAQAERKMTMPEVDGGKTARIILRGCLPDSALSDPGFNSWAIAGLCQRLGVTPVGEVVVRSIPPGVSVGVVIAESRLFVHTWPESSSVRIIIDCCVDFDQEAAAEWLKEMYEAALYEVAVL